MLQQRRAARPAAAQRQQRVVEPVLSLFAPGEGLAEFVLVFAAGVVGGHGDAVHLVDGDVGVLDEDLAQTLGPGAVVLDRHDAIVGGPEVRALPREGAVERVEHEADEHRLHLLGRADGKVEIAEGPDAALGLEEHVGEDGVDQVIEGWADDDGAREGRPSWGGRQQHIAGVEHRAIVRIPACPGTRGREIVSSPVRTPGRTRQSRPCRRTRSYRSRPTRRRPRRLG
ncbi:MAG: hypothetical protein GIKADHBN_03302 [Phycisphaerales bacterium]|nr:hypothetical protein [Phycisphaerales bacterium]